MWYQYRQNNSGGSFTGPALYVLIEAENAQQANAIAEDNGLYFDGVENGSDCDCCGDRWYPCSGEGDPEPMIYGTPVKEFIDTDPYSTRRAREEKIKRCRMIPLARPVEDV